MTLRPWLLIGALSLALGACREPTPPTATDAAPTQPEAPTAGPATPADRADPGPTLERPVGEKPALSRPDVTLEVDAYEAVGGAVYLRALVPTDPRQVVIGPMDRVRIEVVGERYGVAVPSGEGRLPDRAWVYVRLVGEAPPPDPLVLRWHQGALLDGEPGQLQTMNLVGGSTARPFPRLAGRMHEAASRWFAGRRRGPPTIFHAFAAGRMAAWGNPPAERARSAEPLDLLGLDTRRLVPMMLRDRGLRLPSGSAGRVALADIEPPAPVGSPWDALAPAKAPPPDPLAGWAPAEWIYLRLADLGAGLALYDEATTLFGPAVHALTEASGDRRLLDRLLASLALTRPMADALGRATGAAAALLSDPLLDDGPGLVLVLTVKSAEAVEAALAASAEAARAEGWRVDRVRLAGLDVQRLRDPGATALRVVTDGVVLLANSEAGLARVLAARGGDRPLTGEPSFAVLRGRLSGAAEPALWALVGEAHLNHLASPRFRLLAGRRARALADLRALDFTGLLFAWLQGQPYDPGAGRAALTASGLEVAADRVHDHGEPISFEGGRPCSLWGCADGGRPLIDIDLDAVSETEAGAYVRLRAESLDRWREQVAPMAVRVEQRPKGYAVSGQMLPLPKRHGWLDVTRQLAGAVSTAALDGGLELRLAVAPDAPLKAELAEQLRALTTQRDLNLDWLGPQLTVGVLDRSAIWDGVLNVMELPNTAGRRIWRGAEQRKQVLDHLPVYLLADVADRAALDRALVGTRAYAEAPGSLVGWRELGPYRGIRVIELREVLSDAENRIGIFLGIVGEALVVGVDRVAFEMAIDRVLDGKAAAAGGATPVEAGTQVMLQLAPAAGGWLERALTGALERFAAEHIEPARMAFGAVARGTRLDAEGPDRDAALLRWLGFVPTGPHGGTPQLNPAGEVELSQYGTSTTPRWPALPVKGDPLTTLEHLDTRFGFDGEPGRLAVFFGLSWRRR